MLCHAEMCFLLDPACFKGGYYFIPWTHPVLENP